MIAMAGMNPMRYLTSDDPFERGVMKAVAQRRVDLSSDERQDLAGRIITELGRAMQS